jgi:hypothetical protein
MNLNLVSSAFNWMMAQIRRYTLYLYEGYSKNLTNAKIAEISQQIAA